MAIKFKQIEGNYVNEETNVILKEIAEKMGATVTNEDDTNELLALIRDSIGNTGGSGSAESSKLYRHHVSFKYENSESLEPVAKLIFLTYSTRETEYNSVEEFLKYLSIDNQIPPTPILFIDLVNNSEKVLNAVFSAYGMDHVIYCWFVDANTKNMNYIQSSYWYGEFYTAVDFIDNVVPC